MKRYKYNKDNIEFYLSDGSNVSAWQIEDGSVWSIEVFPQNQSSESFESGQYGGGLYLNDLTKPDWNIKEYPEHWDDKLHNEFKEELLEAVKGINLVAMVDYSIT